MSSAMTPFVTGGCAMRHDPASAAVVVMLRGLKMYGMAQAVSDLIEQGAPAFETAVPMLAQLLKAEMAEREVRSIAYQIKSARFPAYKDLAGFDFAASEMNEPKFGIWLVWIWRESTHYHWHNARSSSSLRSPCG
jgi:hypothetical protein